MALLLQLCDRFPKPLDDDGGEALGGLIHDQTVRVGHEPASDGKHLLLTARERSGALAASLVQPREQRVDALHIPAAAVDAALGDHEVLLDAERGKYASALGHEPHAAAHCLERGDSGDVRALEKNLAPARTIETDDRVPERRLAPPLAAQQSERLPFLEPQGQPLDNKGVPEISVTILNFKNAHDQAVPR